MNMPRTMWKGPFDEDAARIRQMLAWQRQVEAHCADDEPSIADFVKKVRCLIPWDT